MINNVGGLRFKGSDWESYEFYYNLIKRLKQNGAPIDCIGFQNHTSIGAPGPAEMFKIR